MVKSGYQKKKRNKDFFYVAQYYVYNFDYYYYNYNRNYKII